MNTVAFIGNYAPRCCGIATFTQDLRTAVLSERPHLAAPVVMVSDDPPRYAYPEEVSIVVSEKDRTDYARAAGKLNAVGADVVSLQHEYGIFGGPAGLWLLHLLKRLKAPVVTTCHTVLREPTAHQRHVMRGIAHYSARMVVMADKGREFLREVYGVPEEKIAVIPHGIPDITLSADDRASVRGAFGWSQRRVLFTFGLVSPAKGLEHAIRALPEIVGHYPEACYVITGATHPNLVRNQGEHYREGLLALANELGVADHLQFINRFVSREELAQLIAAADIYVTPYLNEAQITSGTLANAFGMGKPVISTPYWHAAELLANGHGLLVPFRDSGAIAEAAVSLIRNDELRQSISERAYRRGRNMTWGAVAGAYASIFESVAGAARRTSAVRRLSAVMEKPAFAHLERMTGRYGIYQHAKIDEPDPDHGFCTDDNARAIIALTDLARLGHRHPVLESLFHPGFEFLLDACNRRTDRFRNFMDCRGRWLESCGSEDSHGRALWALGHVGRHHPLPRVRLAALRQFRTAFAVTLQFEAPRAWAFTILGLTNYLDAVSSDNTAEILRDELALRLMRKLQSASTGNWTWFEDTVTYDNGKLPQALLAAARQTGNLAWCRAGLRTLTFLLRGQTAPEGHFRPAGCRGFWPRLAPPAQWDQQPLEAQSMIAACLEAYGLTRQHAWLAGAQRIFAWFTGENDRGLSLVDAETGGCCDGLQETGLNLNKGAESTLAWLQSAAALRLTASFSAAGPHPGVIHTPAPAAA